MEMESYKAEAAALKATVSKLEGREYSKAGNTQSHRHACTNTSAHCTNTWYTHCYECDSGASGG